MRRVVFYGQIPAGLVRALVADLGVQVFLSAPAVQAWMLPALREGAYELLVIDEDAPRAGVLADLVRAERGVPVVQIRAGDELETMQAAIKAATGWGPINQTVFVVVTCTKGGVGKSTLAGAVAQILSAEKHRRVLVIDDNPSQSNCVKLLANERLPAMTAADLARVVDTLPARAFRVNDWLYLLAMEDYIGAGGGVARKDALAFWQAVSGQGYDFVVIDTSPTLVLPDNPGDWTNINLVSVLFENTGAFRSVFVAPFTPDKWGHEGIEATRGLLQSRALDDFLVPAVVAINSSAVLENIPRWLQNGRWGSRLVAIPHNRRQPTDPGSLFEKKLLYDPLKPYRAVVERVLEMPPRRPHGQEP